MPDETTEVVEQKIEIVIPEKTIIDETEGKIIGKFEKIIEEESLDEEGYIVITKKIVPMSELETIEKRKLDIQYKVALGTATTTEKSDLKLLIG